MSHLYASVAAVAIALTIVIVNTRAQQAQQPLPPERGIDLLSVDFAAVSADGRPVPDLRPEEVTIRVGSRHRTIRSLQLISVRPAGDAVRAASLPAPFGTNAESERGRALVLIIDDDSFKAGREGPLRDAVDDLVSRL